MNSDFSEPIESQLKALEHALRWADMGLRYLEMGNIQDATLARDYAQGWFAKAVSIEKFRHHAHSR
jgi:hypothetical protein